jgi:hypothetical protein
MLDEHIEVGDYIKYTGEVRDILTKDKTYEVIRKEGSSMYWIICDDSIERWVGIGRSFDDDWEKVENSKKENINFLDLLKGY